MENQNTNQNENEAPAEEAVEQIDAQAAVKTQFLKNYELPSWFALLLTFGLYACSAMLIMAASIVA